MPAKAIELSPAVADFLKQRRQRLGYSLREVERLTSASGNVIPFSTLARIEQGRLDPGLKRLHALLALYRLPIQAAGDLLAMEALAAPAPAETDPRALRDKGHEAWQRGDIPAAIACYLAMRRCADDGEQDRAIRHESILSLAVGAGKLGRHHLARQMLDDLLLDRPSRSMQFLVFLQLALTWQALGSQDVALVFLEGAAARVEQNDARGLGWVAHQRGMIQIDLGELDSAQESFSEAVRLFRKAKRPYDAALVLVAIARLAVERGSAPNAIRAARRAAAFASARKFARIQTMAAIQEGRGLLLSPHPDRALLVLTRALSASVAASDSVLLFYAHFYLSKVHAKLGATGRSAAEFEQARYFAQFVDQATKEVFEVRGVPHGGREVVD